MAAAGGESLSNAASPPPAVQPRLARGREVAALLLWTAALFVFLALASYAGDPNATPALDGSAPAVHGADWVGPVGAACARAIVLAIGATGWVIPLELALLGVPFVRGKRSLITPARLAIDFLVVLIAAALVQVGWPGKLAFGLHTASGVVGELFGEIARSLFSTIGSFLVGFACLGLLLIARASFSFIALMNWIGQLGAKGARGTADGARQVTEAWRAAREIEREKREADRIADLPHIESPKLDEPVVLTLRDESPNADVAPDLEMGDLFPSLEPAEPVTKRRTRTPRSPRKTGDPAATTKDAISPASAPSALKETLPESTDAPAKLLDSDTDATHAPVAPKPTRRVPRQKPVAAEPVIVDTSAALAKSPPLPVVEAVVQPAVAPVPEPVAVAEPVIVDTSAALEKIPPKPVQLPLEKVLPTKFRLPSIEFLNEGDDAVAVVDTEALYKKAEILIKTLADYKIVGKVEEILPGPTVTTFEVSPQAGTKVSRIAALADDLALALACKVRIVAPIPGKNRIGFELPNAKRKKLYLRDLIDDRHFQELDKPLPCVLGRDIVGKPVYADLADMPHVIVAGATGAGKSVGLNVMLISLLYRRTPEELRLLMIDPKVVELAPFDRIPHMLLPVVTDMKQAANALKWAVDEMERRYQLFADAGTRNIGTYNGWADRVAKGLAKNPNAKVVMAKDFNGFSDPVPGEKGSDEGEAPLPEKLPWIVIVVDEFADLMMQQKGDVETAVARLAQKARAAGMHVILATQRPSVDVITGMIKANFPTRMAYRVAQKVDSRTILDEQGAEHLLGAGDMLVKLNTTNDVKRVQCPFLSEEEVQRVTDFLRTQGEPVYDDNILKPRDDDDEAKVEDDGEKDQMYDQAVRLVAETRRCSTSWLQRKLEIGYNRAARIVETMERRGLVGPPNGAKDREVLIASI
jgi:S-DNA-T family DNA segregation ATPase FtsK/SpoIIIE